MSPQERGAHTPGPWYFYSHKPYDSAPERFAIAQEDGAPYTSNFSDVAEMVSSEKLEIQEANARLIAAAPDLLASLQAAMTILGDSVGDFDYDAACAAIAKATGTQP